MNKLCLLTDTSYKNEQAGLCQPIARNTNNQTQSFLFKIENRNATVKQC